MALPARVEKWRASWEGYSRPKAAMKARKADITILKTVPRLNLWVATEYRTCNHMRTVRALRRSWIRVTTHALRGGTGHITNCKTL